MEKKYLVVVYRNLRYMNNYDEFTDKQKAKNWYDYMLKKAEEQKNEEKDKHNYILDIRLYELTEIE
jgi:hypothetical protein